MITRAEVLRRARTLWPEGGVPYDMGAIHRATGYRQDCSGYVSMCWGIPPDAAPGGWGGLNTVTLVTGGWMREIPVDDLRPGDAVGRCGPGTAGAAGHIQLFEAWDDRAALRHWVLEQAGGARGWRRRLVGWTPGYKAYRYKGITEDVASGGSAGVRASDVWSYDPGDPKAPGALRNRPWRPDAKSNLTVQPRWVLEDTWDRVYQLQQELAAARKRDEEITQRLKRIEQRLDAAPGEIDYQRLAGALVDALFNHADRGRASA